METSENNSLCNQSQLLEAKITNVISGITINQLANVFLELQNRITFCIANDGGHVKT